MKKAIDMKALTKIALLTAVLCISSYIIIPIPFTPIVMTAQTLIVNLIALLLRPRHAALTIGIYMAVGLVGLPVFSGGAGGPGKLFGPTGGYIFGWLIAVFVMALIKGQRDSFISCCLITVLVGMPITDLTGTVYMKLTMGMTWSAAFSAGVLPFILTDICKCIAASAIAKPVGKAIKKMEQ